MKRSVRLILSGILSAVLIYSVARLLGIWLEYRRNEEIYTGAVSSFVSTATPAPVKLPSGKPSPAPVNGSDASPEPTEEPEPEEVLPAPGFTVDFEALRAVNSEIVGWLYVEGTAISYPLMQAEDNSLYLDHAYDMTHNSAGSIFLDCAASPDFSDFHSIVYGHNMKNGSMFGNLTDLQTEEGLAGHRNIYILTPEGTLHYEVFSVHFAYVTDGFYEPVATDVEAAELLGRMARASYVSTGLSPTAADRILTLSTCSGLQKTHRFLVHAVLTEDGRETLSEGGENADE